jgi:hypothetical protein
MSIKLIKRDTPTAAVDFETYYDKDLSLKTIGPWHYVNHPGVEIHTLSVATRDGEFVGRPWEFDWSAIEGMRWISHNAAFDRMVFDACIKKYNLAAKRPPEWQCTANLVAYLGFPRALDKAGKELLEIEMSKDIRKQMKGKTYTEMAASGFAIEMEEYALKDATTCLQLWEKFNHKWPELEQRASLLTMVQTERGLPANVERIELGVKLLERCAWEAASRLPWRNDGSESAVLSPIKLAEHCRNRGIKPPISTAEDSVACAQWCLDNPEITWVQDMRAYRKANLLLTKLKTMHSRVRDDGRIAYGVKYFGGHTGRWSGDQGFNVHGFGKEPTIIEEVDYEGGIQAAIRHKEVTTAEAADEGWIVDMRACIELASENHTLFISDLSQIEPRVLHRLAGDFPFLDEVRGGMSIYEVHARQVLGWKGGKLKDENPALYQKCKAEVLGLGYGMGPPKYQAYALGYGLVLSSLECKKVVNTFRRKKPLIVQYWDSLQEQLDASIGGNLEIELSSGRKMVYRDVHKRVLTNKTTGKKRQQLCATLAGGRIGALWGSVLAENVVQGESRDVFLEAMLRVEDAGFPTFLSVHDEMLGECDAGTDIREIEEIIARPPDWAPNLPVASEGHLSKFYLK